MKDSGPESLQPERRKPVAACVLVAACLIFNVVFAQDDAPGTVAGEFDSFIEKAFALELSPGRAVAVVRGSDIIYANGFGYADMGAKRRVTPETMFYIASTTKSFTAFAVVLLAERGELDLDNPISRYLPNLRLRAPLSADDITLRDLLTHTHGIESGGPVVFRTAYTGVYTNDQLIELLGAYGPATTSTTATSAITSRVSPSRRNWGLAGRSWSRGKFSNRSA